MSSERKVNLEKWDPDDSAFWSERGKGVAWTNLIVSIVCLASAFGVWILWSVIIVQMEATGFALSKAELYSLPAIAGLTGATMRIPSSFLVGMSGGRNVTVVTTALLLIPTLGAGLALRAGVDDYTVYAALAACCGFGGGAFASSMSNISGFFPKRMQGLALGLNGGVGNLGVSAMQVLLPILMVTPILGAHGGEGRVTAAGVTLWLQNGGLLWVPLLIAATGAALLGMNNLPQHAQPSQAAAMGRTLWMLALALVGAAAGIVLLVGVPLGVPPLVKTVIVLVVSILVTLALMRVATPASIRASLKAQQAIFSEKHCWAMTWLYVMTFGSFIGFSSAFPKLIQDVFGTLADGSINPDAPSPLAYAWLGPLVGSLVRPLGGWISDHLGGARVTQWTTVIMVGATLAAGYFVAAAGDATNPSEYWWPFLALFLLLFVATGIGNGSTFRMVPFIFRADQSGPVLGWISAVAAYGAFVIPQILGQQIQAGTPEYAFYGFALYYLSCLALNWWYYYRRGAEHPC